MVRILLCSTRVVDLFRPLQSHIYIYNDACRTLSEEHEASVIDVLSIQRHVNPNLHRDRSGGSEGDLYGIYCKSTFSVCGSKFIMTGMKSLLDSTIPV